MPVLHEKIFDMKKFSLFAVLVFVSISLSSCDLIEGLFKGGLIIGLIIAALIIALLSWIFFQAFRKERV